METRGAAIAECVRDIKVRGHLKRLSEKRDKENEFRKRRQRKEACTAATEQASTANNAIKLYNNDNTEKAVCQDGGVLHDKG